MDTMGKDVMVRILTGHWGRPYVEEGYALFVDCTGAGCGFRSSPAEAGNEDKMWAEHAGHVAEQLQAAGITDTASAVTAERLRLADRLDEEVTRREAQPWLRWSPAINLGWTQAANHLRHPTATS